MMGREEMIAVASAMGYALNDSREPLLETIATISCPTVNKCLESLLGTGLRNSVAEFWHALNRSTPFREKQVANEDVDAAIAHTLAWVKFYQKGAHRCADSQAPEWGKEY